MYNKAVSRLQHHYNKPHLIHQAHIHSILNVPSLIDDDGKELCQFHDIANQYLRVLKVVKHDSFKSLVTAIFKAKMDQVMMQKWQRYIYTCTVKTTILAATRICGS